MRIRGPVFVLHGLLKPTAENQDKRACSIDVKLHCMCNAHPSTMIGSGWASPSDWAGSIHFDRRMRLISMML